MRDFLVYGKSYKIYAQVCSRNRKACLLAALNCEENLHMKHRCSFERIW